ncbi:MAG: ribonuclease E/G [Candidatus Limivivens sp.]|nr:ribonuclease E/G [Candidatus Limivivens sp.]
MTKLNRKLILVRLKDKILTALLEDGQVCELHCDEEKRDSLLGNIYIGKVRNIVSNIQAAFIEIENGIQCYYSLSDNKTPIYTKKGNSKKMVPGDELLVQVCRENLKSKPPAVTSNLNFTGNYVVLTTENRNIGLSAKLTSEEKKLLRTWIAPFEDERFGFIIRTNAREVSQEVFQDEVRLLIDHYENLIAKAKYRTCYSILHKNNPATWLTALRDTYKENLTEILTDDPVLYTKIKEYLEQYQKEDLDKLRFYEDATLPLIKLYSLEAALESALKERVWLKSGAYLIVQPTEALTVFDVNTGKFDGRRQKQDTFLKINLEAAREIARQIRLRNLSGIIVIDFINMDSEEYRKELMDFFAAELRKDPVKTTLVDMTVLELVEVTRKKVRKPLYEQVGKEILHA